MKRSNSCSEICTDYKSNEDRDPAQVEKETHARNCKLLDPAFTARYDQYKLAYADLLYRWGLLNKRAELLKYVSAPAEPDPGLELFSHCQKCNQMIQGPNCKTCNAFAIQCVICRMPVKGSSSFCMSCGHGGHSSHLMEWFSAQRVCPTGCGCYCLNNGEPPTVS